MAEIVSKDDICNYFDLVGNHDDPDLYLFVKTAEHLCTLDYNCRLPTGIFILCVIIVTLFFTSEF